MVGRRVRAVYRSIPLMIIVVLTVLFHLVSRNREIMTTVSGITLEIKLMMAGIYSIVPVSVAEIMVYIAIVVSIGYTIKSVVEVIRSRRKLETIYRKAVTLITVAAGVYLGLCIMLGASYNAYSFSEQAGIQAEAATVEALYETTRYYAQSLSAASKLVKRDTEGRYNEDIDEIIERSTGVYGALEEEYSFLERRETAPKKVLASELMSAFAYTGFYFPFTGEANINVSAPGAFIPATIAHEIAHQKGIASESEANFAAILACTSSSDPAYQYSGWLLGYVYLSNALYKYDRGRFEECYRLLNAEVWADLDYNNRYWEESVSSEAAEVSEAIQDGMLRHYGQELGVMSYGAVVELLIAHHQTWIRQ